MNTNKKERKKERKKKRKKKLYSVCRGKENLKENGIQKKKKEEEKQ